MKFSRMLSLLALLCLGAVNFAQTVPNPEPPSLWREVAGIVDTFPNGVKTPVHSRPHVPAFRTSRDGRVALRVLPYGDFALIIPEKLPDYVRLIQNANPANNSYVMSSTTYKYVDGVTNASSNPAKFYSVLPGTVGSVGHFTLYDPTPANPTAGEQTNPQNLNGTDVYHLKVLAGFNYGGTDPNHPGQSQFFVTDVTVTVTNPKTAQASISSITTGTPVPGPVLSYQGVIREPNIVGDGRLIVFRAGTSSIGWTDPDTGVVHPPQVYDIVYSYYTGGNPADPKGWTNLIPISHAPFDSRINTKFGFARYPFRDPAGNAIPDGAELRGTYPWIDRDAKNLFFTVLAERLRYSVSGVWNNINYSRYPQADVQGDPVDLTLAEEPSGTRGVCFAGLWSRGKIVLLDTLNNDIDYALGDGSTLFPRMVHLFDSSQITPPPPEWLEMAAGRVNALAAMPAGDNRNSTILDSLESIFNYRSRANPISVRDVVWPLHNAKQSDDLVFDDYVDADAFIVANMTGLATFGAPASVTNRADGFYYYSGWDSTNHQFDTVNFPVKLQNAATTTLDRWAVPTCGLMVGPGRLEPAATGGIHGKGFWMGGSTGLQFTVLAQPQNVANHDWYAGLFVDCHHDNDTTDRMLLSFPDGTKILLHGRSQILYLDATGSLLRTVVLPTAIDMVPDMGWAHLAWQIRSGGTVVEFLLNGLTFDRFVSTTPLFQFTPGNLIVGKNSAFSNPGFTGWIDDFVVLAHAVDPETACNHAGGTLVGLTTNYTGTLRDIANLYPTSTRTEISSRLLNSGQRSFPTYANFYNYTQDYGAHLGNIPAGAVSVRETIHFPEGPLYYNAPRPDSGMNSFCLTCHTSTGKGGLNLNALTLNTALNADADSRRQPHQPFRRVFGNIPIGFVDSTGLPTAATVASASGQPIDDLLLPAFVKATVKTFTLVDAGNHVDLTQLKNGDTVNRATYGASSYAIRANLDSEQGSVTLSFDGGSPETCNTIPYSIAPASLSAGSHSVTATPQKGGVAVTITFTVQ